MLTGRYKYNELGKALSHLIANCYNNLHETLLVLKNNAMEWIRFELDVLRSANFEKEFLPQKCRQFDEFITRSEATWTAYVKESSSNGKTYYFCSDSPFMMQYVKNWTQRFERIPSPKHKKDLRLIDCDELIKMVER